ncbi:MAG TPA: hypothetical protein VJP88_08575 [Caulobacteraceae bacterium]|nr:hypothetical protein [Caulobacteraceae bacterium]
MKGADTRFADDLRALEDRARKVGMSHRELAAAADCSPATLGRWKRRAPATIRVLTRMEQAVAERERARKRAR